MRLPLFTTFLVMFMVLLLPAILALGIKNIPQSQQPSLDGTIKLFGARKISQLITIKENNFTGIGVSIRNPNFIDKNNLVFSVYENTSLIRKVSINSASISDGDLLKINFPPIADSQNKNYIIEFSSPDSTDDKYFEVFISNKTGQTKGQNFQLFSNGKNDNYDGSIAYELFYKPQNPISLIVQIYTNVLVKLAKDTAFFIFYLVLVSSLAIYFLKKN